MTAKDCIAWMKTTLVPGIRTRRTIYSCWVLPQLNLNKEFSRYDGRPVGDSAELMPLDTTLNKDVHECARRHVVMSRSGAAHGCRDTRLFSFATPKEVARTYRRVFDPVDGVAPKPKRIVQDVKRAISAMKTIHEHRGAFVPGLAGGRVAGHRHVQTTAKTSDNHGGKREKKEWGDNFPMHKDLRSLLDEPERDVTGLFAVHEDVPDDLDPDEYVEIS